MYTLHTKGQQIVSAYLTIGTVAKILGVTPKTIRHYHRIGLLAEPPRTSAGYRCYGASDILRLQRIKQLQKPGLTLQQIKAVLGEPDQERSLRSVLHTLHNEIAAQIVILEARRKRIAHLLADVTLDALAQPAELPPTLERLHAYLGDLHAEIDPALWELDARLFAQLDAFLGDDRAYQQLQHDLVECIVAHPDAYRQLFGWGKRFVALAHAPEDAPEIALLAQELLSMPAQNPILARIAAIQSTANGEMVTILGEVLQTEMVTTLRLHCNDIRKD